MGTCSYEIRLSAAEHEYCNTMWKMSEMALVSAGIGGGFIDTNELHVMKYKEAMAGKDTEKWQKAVDEEHECMMQHHVWEPVPIEEVPKGSKILTLTWAMKKKANKMYRVRRNACGYEQINGVHYNKDLKTAPVANEIVIRMVMVLIVMASWWAELLDVQGAFLTGEMDLENGCYLQVPEGFSKFYPKNVILHLLKTLYSLKQSTYVFWKSLVMAFWHMTFECSKADPCQFFKWTVHGLVLWVTWVDDCLVCGKKEVVLAAKKQLMDRFNCNEIGELMEYIGCKVDRGDDWMKLIHPVLLQSFEVEFDLPNVKTLNTLVAPGKVLHSGTETSMLNKEMQTKYRSGTGKLLHLMKWLRPNVLNSVRELSCFMTGAMASHLKAMYQVMQYCVGMKERGLTLKT